MKQHSTILTTFAVIIAFLNTDLQGANADAHAQIDDDEGLYECLSTIRQISVVREIETPYMIQHRDGRELRLPPNLGLIFLTGIGDIKAVEACLQAPLDINYNGLEGTTALWIAAHNHNTPIVQLLLERRASANAANPDGETPLHAALCEPGGNSTIEMLVAHGADVDYLNGNGLTPYMMADEEQQQVMRAAQAKSSNKLANNIEEAKEETRLPRGQNHRRSPAEASRSANNSGGANEETPLLGHRNQSGSAKPTLFSRIKRVTQALINSMEASMNG